MQIFFLVRLVVIVSRDNIQKKGKLVKTQMSYQHIPNELSDELTWSYSTSTVHVFEKLLLLPGQKVLESYFCHRLLTQMIIHRSGTNR